MVVEQEVGNVKLCTAADRVLRRHYHRQHHHRRHRRHYLHQHHHRRREFKHCFLTKYS